MKQKKKKKALTRLETSTPDNIMYHIYQAEYHLAEERLIRERKVYTSMGHPALAIATGGSRGEGGYKGGRTHHGKTQDHRKPEKNILVRCTWN